MRIKHFIAIMGVVSCAFYSRLTPAEPRGDAYTHRIVQVPKAGDCQATANEVADRFAHETGTEIYRAVGQASLVSERVHGAFAADILWLKLTPGFTYKDISTACSTTHFPKTLYFGAEVDGGQANLAVLKDSTFEPVANKIAFLKEELSGIELHQDKFDRLWMKNLTLSARLLGWVFTNAGDSFGGCKPPQPLKTVSLAPFAFAFNVEGLGETVIFSESQLGTFKGQRKDGGAYVATVQWRQRQFESGPDWNRHAALTALPWTKRVSAQGSSSIESSARFQTQNNLRRETDRQRRRCNLDNGRFTAREGFMRCRKLRSIYRCENDATCYCRTQRDDSESKVDFGDDLEEVSSNARIGSPVFSDRQDCRAIAMNNPGLCRGQDCRGVLYNILSYCRSNDCKAMVRGLAGLCQTRDCRAVVYNNVGFCESFNCRAVLYGNAGLCR